LSSDAKKLAVSYATILGALGKAESFIAIS